MPDYSELARQFRDPGAFFNATERARRGEQLPQFSGMSEEDLIAANRYAQSADSPGTAAAAIPYEFLKMIEQQTPVNPLSGIASAYEYVQGPNALSQAIRPDETTSPASLQNVTASLSGGRDALLRKLAELFKREG